MKKLFEFLKAFCACPEFPRSDLLPDNEAYTDAVIAFTAHKKMWKWRLTAVASAILALIAFLAWLAFQYEPFQPMTLLFLGMLVGAVIQHELVGYRLEHGLFASTDINEVASVITEVLKRED